MTDLTRNGRGDSRRNGASLVDSPSAVFRAPVSAEVDGLSVSGFADQHAAYLRALRAGRGESFAIELFRSAVEPGSVVVDGGAYLGYHTLVAAGRTGRHGRVFSFEPHPRAFHCLQRNLHENGLSDRVHARRECLGDGVGITSFHLAGGDGSESSMFVPRSPAGSRAAIHTTLDQALDGGGCVDVMKLDVEGGELSALRGMRRTLARSPGMRLLVKYNPRALRRADVQPLELLSELHELGFDLRVVDEGRREPAPLEHLDSLLDTGAGHVNLWCRLQS